MISLKQLQSINDYSLKLSTINLHLQQDTENIYQYIEIYYKIT